MLLLCYRVNINIRNMIIHYKHNIIKKDEKRKSKDYLCRKQFFFLLLYTRIIQDTSECYKPYSIALFRNIK